MTTTENNKLLAEFMNWEYTIVNNTTLQTTLISDLDFSKDWNWVMKVVEKIESLDGHLHICDNDVFVHFPKRIKGCVRINGESLKLSKIEAVYNACVEFIKWHNENKD